MGVVTARVCHAGVTLGFRGPRKPPAQPGVYGANVHCPNAERQLTRGRACEDMLTASSRTRGSREITF